MILKKIIGKKSLGSSITDIPEIYLISDNQLVNKPMQVLYLFLYYC